MARIWSILLLAQPTFGIQLDVHNRDSIRSAASTIAAGMLDYYKGDEPGQIPGVLPPPYYWWESGAMFGTLIDYHYYTGDTTFDKIITEAMLFQVGPEANFMPPNQTKSLGNDDQSFWGLAAMSAAEQRFPDPPPDKPQWLALAQAVFDSQTLRWHVDSCNGGLKWQIFSFNTGYNYKNSISNGCFFNLAARLGMYTNNETYFQWADRIWEWTAAMGLISHEFKVFDGTNDNANCTSLNHMQWSYNAGVFLLGAAVMWNQTQGEVRQLWETRVRGLIKSADVFFFNNIMFEAACEPSMSCDTDQQSFKAYLSRWMAATIKVASFTEPLLQGYLQTTAQAAAQSCSGGTDGVTCGTRWTGQGWDQTWGIGQQMNALEVVQGLLIDTVPGPVGIKNGGTSRGKPTAGHSGDGIPGTRHGAITAGSRALAGLLTIAAIVATFIGGWFVCSE